MNFQVIPAIDLRGGHVVRLRQGDYASETIFPVDPIALAQCYADQGATWLHVVDLDGARAGRFENIAVLEAIAETGSLKVQAGGGVRSVEDLRRLYSAGVARAVIGSIAIQDPETTTGWLDEFGAEALVMALDARREADEWRLPVHGWTEEAGVQLDEIARHYAQVGAHHILCTDISRDGTLDGFNLDLYHHLRTLAPDFCLQASGGASSLDDIRRVRDAGARAVILGRALLEQRFTLAEALAC